MDLRRAGGMIAGLLVALAAVPAWPATPSTTQVSVSSTGVPGNKVAGQSSISADGRFIAFDSSSTNLVPGVSGRQVYVRDRIAGTTVVASVDASGAARTGYNPAISGDGRTVAFESHSAALVPGDTNSCGFGAPGTCPDIFVRDLVAGVTERVSVGNGGVQADRGSLRPSISGDGRYVAFASWADNLVPGDANGDFDVFVRDRLAGQTVRASVATSGAGGNAASDTPAISADGRVVAFESRATNFDARDDDYEVDVYARDLAAGTTERISTGAVLNPRRPSYGAAISGDGRIVAFTSLSRRIVAGDLNGVTDVFYRDRVTGTTRVASANFAGLPANGDSGDAAVSADGRWVAFGSWATDMTVEPPSGHQIFVRDVLTGAVEQASLTYDHQQPWAVSDNPSISADGRYVSFQSGATNMVPQYGNGVLIDVFLRDRG